MHTETYDWHGTIRNNKCRHHPASNQNRRHPHRHLMRLWTTIVWCGNLDQVKNFINTYGIDADLWGTGDGEYQDLDEGNRFTYRRVIWSQFDIVRYRIKECHVDVERENHRCANAFSNAIDQNHFDIVQYRIKECHADVEAKVTLGRYMTLLLLNCKRGKWDIIVKYLVLEWCNGECEC